MLPLSRSCIYFWFFSLRPNKASGAILKNYKFYNNSLTEDGNIPWIHLWIQCNPYQILSWHLCRNGQTYLRLRFPLVWKCMDSQIAKAVLRDNSWGSHSSWFQTYHKATVIQIVWYRRKDRHRDQRGRIKSQTETRIVTVSWFLTRPSHGE